MANIPLGSMSTEVKLDGSQSVKTLRELKQAVTQATSAWKAQRAELASVGKSTEAAEAKYKGLSESIQKQKELISGFEASQKHLAEAQKAVDRSTKEGRQEYGKYNEALQKNETRLHSAEQKLQALIKQQTKAKSSLNYYKSGLADVQKQLKSNEAVAKSYVIRLNAEGKSYESAKAKLNSYKDSLANLRKQQTIQNSELSRIARETGKTSEAYKHQEIRVNQTATSIAHLNGKIKSSQKELNNLNPRGLDKVANAASKLKSHFDNVNKSGEKTHSLFKTIFSANVISNAATGAFGAIKDKMGEIYQSSKQYALEQQTMNATWLTLTNSASKGQAMVKQINDMAIAAQNSTKMVDTLSQKFYAINNNAKQTGELTKSILTLQDAFGQTDAAVENFGTQFSQMMANGKVSAQDMMSIVNTFPKLRPMLLDYEQRIHHSSNMTMQEMNKMMSAGKIKSQDMINVVLEAGKKYQKATGNFIKTIPGMTRVVQAQMPVLLSAFTKPLTKMESPVYAAISRWVSSKKTNQEFATLGKTVSTGMNSVMKAFSGGKAVDVTKGLDNAINGINKGLKGVFGWISGHAKDLKIIASSVASIGSQIAKTVWKDFASVITTIGNMFGLTAKNSKSSSGAIHVIAKFLNSLAKNKLAIQVISKSIVAIATVKGLNRVGSSLLDIGAKGYHAYKKIKALKAGIKGVQDIKDFKETEQGFFGIGQNAKKAYKWVKSLFGAGKSAGKLTGALKSIHSAGGIKGLSTAGKVATGVAGAGVAADVGYNAIFKAFQDRHSATKRSQDIGKGIGAGIGGGIGLWFGGPLGAAVGAKVGEVVGKWGGQAVNNFIKGWQKNKPPKSFWSLENLGYSAHNMWKGFKKSVTNTAKWFKKNWKEVGVYFVSPLAGAINSLYKHNPKFRKWVKGLVKGFKKSWKDTGKWFGKLGKNIQKSWHGMTSWFKKLSKNMAKGLKSSWKSMTKWFSNIGKGIKKSWRGLTSWFSKLGKGMSKGLKATWHNITKWFANIGRGIKKSWSNMTSFFTKLGKNTANFFKHPWKSIKSWFSGIIDGIKSTWDGFWSHVSGPLNKLSHIHFANGTDWRKKYGVPAIVNDAPGDNYREGLLVNGKVIPFPAKRNMPFWLLPGQDIVNGNDMAKLYGRHFASGTVKVADDKKELKKLGDRITKALKDKDGNEARRLTKEFNKLTKKYSEDKKASKKHSGKILVDQGLLIGAKSRIGHSVYISKDLYNKLIKKLDDEEKARKKRERESKRKTTRRRRTTTSTRVSYVTPRISTASIKGKSVKISAKVSGGKAVKALAKSIKAIKGGTHKVKVKTSGSKSVKSLAKQVKKIKGHTSHVKVKTSGTSSLKSLQRNITSVHKRINSLNSAIKKNKFGKAISRQAVEAVKSLKGKGNFTKQFASMTKKFDKDLKNMTKNSKKEFKSMWSENEKASKSGERKLNSELSSFSRKYKNGWKSLENAVSHAFSHFWTTMRNTAGKGVNKVIRVLNSAIGKIDSVISQFGGSKSAVHKSGLVHYATGTDSNGRLTHDTLAIVNDAQSGPRQEAIVTDTNDVILPRGNNVPVMLKKGWGVLNGTQTQSLGLPHFASGTGLKGLYDLAKKYWSHPDKTGKSMFGAVTGLTGAVKDLATGMRSKSEKSGTKWWSQLWKMVEDKVNDDLGPASGLLKAVEKLGRNKHYSQGKRMSKFFADCSSLVSRALHDFYHVKWSVPNGWALTVAGLWQHAHKISRSQAKPGDPVFWLPDEHVGIYAGHNKYYSAYGPNDGGPVGMQTVAPGATFGRFDGLNTEGSKSDTPKVKANTQLQKRIRGQVGKGFWNTIQKIADKFGDSGLGAFKLGGDIAQRVKALAKALKRADPRATKHGIAAIVGNAITESTLNPGIVNDIGAAGLWQFYDARRAGLNSYASRHDVSWKNPATQINYALNADGSKALFRSILEGNGSVSSLAYKFSKLWEVGGHDAAHVQGALQAAKILGYANGGITNQPAVFGEAGPEMAIPLIPSKSTRAWELIGKAVGILSSRSNLQVENSQTEKERKEEHDFRQAVLLLLQELVAKNNNVDVKLTTPAGRALWEVVEPYSKQEQRAEQIRERRGLSGRFR